MIAWLMSPEITLGRRRSMSKGSEHDGGRPLIPDMQEWEIFKMLGKSPTNRSRGHTLKPSVATAVSSCSPVWLTSKSKRRSKSPAESRSKSGLEVFASSWNASLAECSSEIKATIWSLNLVKNLTKHGKYVYSKRPLDTCLMNVARFLETIELALSSQVVSSGQKIM